MTTGSHQLGRGITSAGLVIGLGYLGWRITSTLAGVPWWLAAGALVVEIGGFLAVALLTWALWRTPLQATPAARLDTDFPLDVQVVVRCAGQGTEQLRATLLASRDLGPVSVVDLEARPEVAALAIESGASYVATDADDLDGLWQAAQTIDAPNLLLLEAGDIPHPDIVSILVPWFDDPSVAVVQGLAVPAGDGSAEHAVGERHDKDVERRAIVPSLGARGLAPFTGTGALIRRAAVLHGSITSASPPMVQSAMTAALFESGWKIVAPGGPAVVAAASIDRPADVESVRACEASGAVHGLIGPSGALRFNSLTVAQRLALLALAVRPLAGIRRSVAIVVLLGALLAGSLPFSPTVEGLVGLWAPWFACAALGLWLLSGGTLRPGDRLRSSMRVLGASWRGAIALDGRPDRPRHTLAGAFGLSHGVAPAAAVAAISVVVGLRGISDRLSHTLEPLPTDHTAGLLVVALWMLGGGLDSLRLLARRVQARRSTRVTSSLPCTFADRAALVVDLTPLGAGVICDGDLEVGTGHELEVVLPTASGCVSATVGAVVRNSRADVLAARRVGVEFGPMPAHLADALAEFCLVQPAYAVLEVSTVGAGVGATTGAVHPLTVIDDQPLVPRRVGLRAAALVAVAGALASSVPTSAEAAGLAASSVRGDVVIGAAPPDTSTPDTSTPTTGTPDTSTPGTDTPTTDTTGTPTTDAPSTPAAGPVAAAGTVVSAVCSLDAGVDEQYGTSDDVYGAPVSAVVGDDGGYELGLDGDACWMVVAPPVGTMLPAETSELESATTPQVVDLSGRSSTIEVPAVELRPASDGASTGAAGVDDVVWADLDRDGTVGDGEAFVAGVRVTLYDAVGSVVGTTVTGSDGRFAFTDLADDVYQLGVSNLPDGLSATSVLGRSTPFSISERTDVNLAIGLVPAARPAPVVSSPASAAAAPASERLLAEPAADQVAVPTPERSPVGVLLVVFLATLIGLSVLAGSVRPARPRPQSTSPDLAIR